MIHLTNITRRHGSQILFQNASFQILPGARTGLVGPNGAGKSTIFRLITGEEEPDKGEISCPKKTVIGYFSQDVGDMSGRSALAEVMAASSEVLRLGEQMREMETAMGQPMADVEMEALLERYGNAVEEFEHRGGYDLETRAQSLLTGLGIGPDDFHRPVELFSGGWKMRIELAKILTLNPDVLLLDEPTNHLDVESIIWLIDHLAGRVADQRIQGRPAHDLPRPGFHEPHRLPHHRGGQPHSDHLQRQLRLLSARTGNTARTAAGQLPPPAGDAGQGGAIHRPLCRPAFPLGPGPVAGQKNRENRTY
jgi:ABC-type multidrug transport system ATPase subunit